MTPETGLLGHLRHLNINVADLDRSVAFYERLGVRAVTRFAYGADEAAPTCAAFGLAPMAFKGALMQLADDPLAACFDLVQWDGPAEAAPGPAHAIGVSRLAITTGDARAVLAKLDQWAIPLLGPPCTLTVSETQSYDLFCFRDPDGTILEIVG